MKKVLILTVSNGDNYNMAARAIANGFATRYSSVSFKILDIFKINKSVEFNFAGESTLAEKYAHKLENDRYIKAKHAHTILQKKKIVEKYISVARPYIERMVQSYEPDIIISTHLFAAILSSEIKEQRNDIKTVYVSADFTAPPCLELANNLDLYIVSSKNMAKEFVETGIKKDKCHVLGIPLVAKFDKHSSRNEARELLHLDEDKFTILLTNGTKQRDNNFMLFKVIANKFKDSDIIAVCNKNIKLQSKIKKYIKSKNLKNVKVYGHTNNIDILIAASDVVLGKTSGVEVSEAMAIHVPYVATLKMSGQELDNMKFLKAEHLLINARTLQLLVSRLEEFKESKKIQKSYVDKIAKFYHPYTTDELVKLIFHM